MNEYMKLAIKEAREGILNNHGGPFGSIIVKDSKIIGKGHNRVLLNNDPTAHGEITAIREACKNINSYDLQGSILYTTGEPCPMCLAACMWANIDKIYYGCTIKDNEQIGFRDAKFASILESKRDLSNYLECIDRDECLKLFAEYNNMNKTLY